MLRFALPAALALCLGCGARGGLSLDEPPDRADSGTSRRDAGRRDSGPFRSDAGRPDAGGDVPPGCELSVIVPPTTLRATPDWVDAPQAEIIGDRALLMATYVSVPGPSVRSALGSETTLDLVLQDLIRGDVPVGPTYTAVSGGVLGMCYQHESGRQARLGRYAGSGATFTDIFGEATCEGIAGRGDGWLVALGLPGDGGPWWVRLDPDGVLLTMPEPTYPELLGGGRIAVTAFGDGFAWVVTSQTTDVGRVGAVGRLGDGLRSQVDVPDLRGGLAAPAIAPWAFDDTRLAIAAWLDGLRVIVVDPTAGEVLRSDMLAFSMSADLAPAIVAHPRGAIVASLGYGDADPTGGQLQVAALDARGEVSSSVELPTRRSDDLRFGGVDLATDGDRIVVHWAEVLEEPSARQPASRAMVLACR